MTTDPELQDRAREAQERLRTHLRRLAAANDESFAPELQAVRDALDGFEALLNEDRDRVLPWTEDARERIARCRVELKHLESGQALRKDVIGIVRLVVPRFEKDVER
jgi:hypothetical protein